MSDQPKPKPSIVLRFIQAYKGLKESASKLASDASSITDPTLHSNQIAVMTELLKALAEHQREMGEVRKDMGRHNEQLRKAKPKGKASIENSKPFMIGGYWYKLVNGEPVKLTNLIEEPETKEDE